MNGLCQVLLMIWIFSEWKLFAGFQVHQIYLDTPLWSQVRDKVNFGVDFLTPLISNL